MQIYIAVHKSQAPQVAGVLAYEPNLFYEDLVLFSDMSVVWADVNKILDGLHGQAIAFNATLYGSVEDFQPSQLWYPRYDHTGAVSKPDISLRVNGIDHIRRMLIHDALKDVRHTRQIDRMANTLFIRDEWEHQAEYGKIHRTLKLIGGL